MLILALSNLTRNAIQHAESPTVHVTVDSKRAKVIDEGLGLPPELIEQLHSAGPKPDVGIGLATVQRICDRFGWEFQADSPASGGTAATIELSTTADGRFGPR